MKKEKELKIPVNEIELDKKGRPVDAWLALQVRVLQGYLSISRNRSSLIRKIKKGLSETKQKRLLDTFDIVIDNPEEDEISLVVLTNWKQLTDEEKMNYYIYIQCNSEEGQAKAYAKAQHQKMNLRNRFNVFGGVNK